ncbi:MAG: type II secretion system inner membrane protein GspF [Deltaproteobacteria bacterium]|nr:type II secretion system inner membrane protein GspF [Deltaproteobacteria bacterium]
MPVYEYTALDSKGKNLKGIIDADSARAARQKLRSSEIFPVDIAVTYSEKKRTSLSRRPSGLFRRVRASELSIMTRQLSILLGAGIPLVSCLESLITQVTNPYLKRIMAQVKETVNQGGSFASALSDYPAQFSPIYVNMVRAGEASGSLDVVLDRLADFSESQEALRGRIRAALAYPVFMSLIGAVVLFILMSFIIPDIMTIFDEMEHTLPLPTQLLINVSNFLKSFWWAVLVIIFVVTAVFLRAIHTVKGRTIWDGLKIRAPVIGHVNIRISLARFGRSLGSLLESGVPLIQALEIVRNILNNSLMAGSIDMAMDEIQAGKSLADPLSGNRWIPPVFIKMIAVGEQSGEVEKMLHKIADIYEKEAESRIIAMTSMLEPVMILIMALIVGFIAVSILFPIFEMSQMIR